MDNSIDERNSVGAALQNCSDTLRLAVVQFSGLRQSRTSEQSMLWLPGEPLAGTSSTSSLSPLWSLDTLIKENPNSRLSDLANECCKIYDENIAAKLDQVLKFCADLHVDVVVFPEYSLPISAIRTMQSYRNQLTVVAGVGFVRNSELQQLNDFGFAPLPTEGQNVAVVIGKSINTTVSKKHAAAKEAIQGGSGSSCFSLTDQINFAVSICLDFIAEGAALATSDQRIHFVAIPALTTNFSAFNYDAPRDFVRLLANPADLGGSYIGIPNLAFPGFVNPTGTSPLPKDAEGIIVVDYGGFQSKPAARKTPQNKLIARSALIYEPDEQLLGSIVAAMDNFSRPGRLEGAASFASNLQQLQSTLGQMSATTMPKVLSENIDFIVHNNNLLPTEIHVLSRHVLLKSVLSNEEIRYKQLAKIEDRLQKLVSSDAAKFAPALGEYSRALSEIAPKTRNSKRQRRHNTESIVRGNEGERVSIFSAILGGFSTEEAIESLPQQLVVLRTLVKIVGLEIKLSYFVRTVKKPSGDTSAQFIIDCTAPNTINEDKIEKLRETFGQLIASSLSGYYSFSYGTETFEKTFDWSATIELGDSKDDILEFGPGWTPTINYLRSLGNEVQLEFSCEASNSTAASPKVSAKQIADTQLEESQAKAIGYLNGLSEVEDWQQEKLCFKLKLTSASPLDEVAVWSVARQVFGRSNVNIVLNPTEIKGMNLSPEHALRVFHVPFGRIYGGRKRDITNIFAPEPKGDPVGILLGKAKTRQMRSDEDIEVRISDKDRFKHFYVVGKTGSGKTNLLKAMAEQDVKNPECPGVVVIDPHGDLIDHVVSHIPETSLARTFVLDFGKDDYIPSFNPLLDSGESESLKNSTFEILIETLINRIFHEHGGPILEDNIRLTLETISNSNYPFQTPNLGDVPTLMRTEKSAKAIKKFFEELEPEVADRWEQFVGYFNSSEHNTNYFTSKFGDLVSSGILKLALSGTTGRKTIERVVEQSGILLLKIPQNTIGSKASDFIGTVVLSKLQRALFGRKLNANLKPFYVYVDEFQNYSNTAFDRFVAEARKFQVGFVLANQNLRQLEPFQRHSGGSSQQLREAILGNVGSVVVTGVSARDASDLNPAVGLKQDSSALTQVGRWQAVAKLTIDGEDFGPFTLRPPEAISRGGTLNQAHLEKSMLEAGVILKRSEIEKIAADRSRNLRDFLGSSRIQKAVKALVSDKNVRSKVDLSFVASLKLAEQRLFEPSIPKIAEESVEDMSKRLARLVDQEKLNEALRFTYGALKYLKRNKSDSEFSELSSVAQSLLDDKFGPFEKLLFWEQFHEDSSEPSLAHTFAEHLFESARESIAANKI